MQDAGLYISLCLAGVIVGMLWAERRGRKNKIGQDNRIKNINQKGGKNR